MLSCPDNKSVIANTGRVEKIQEKMITAAMDHKALWWLVRRLMGVERVWRGGEGNECAKNGFTKTCI